MKSGLMASIIAVELLKDTGVKLPGDVKIVSVVDESRVTVPLRATWLDSRRMHVRTMISRIIWFVSKIW